MIVISSAMHVNCYVHAAAHTSPKYNSGTGQLHWVPSVLRLKFFSFGTRKSLRHVLYLCLVIRALREEGNAHL